MERKHINATDILYSVTGPLISCLSPGKDAVSIAPFEKNHTSVLLKDHTSSLLLDVALRINILGAYICTFTLVFVSFVILVKIKRNMNPNKINQMQ